MHRLTSSLSAYACHVTRSQQWRNRVFNRSCRRKDEYLSLYTHFLTGKKKSSNSSVDLKLDDKWSLNSANFCRCRSCDFTDLNTTTGKQIPKRDRFSWQEVMSFAGTSSGQTTGVGALVMSFTGSSLYRLPVGAVPVKKPLQWLPVISPVWSWNPHQRPFHWWDCWGTGSSHVPVKLSRNPPSVVTSDQPCFDTGASTRGLSTGVTVGGTVSSLVQTTGAAAQRVHLPEVAVTIETLISPVQNFGPVPVLFRLPVGSLASQWWGIPAPVLFRLPVVVTQIQQGLPVKQDYRLYRVAGDTAGLLV